MYILIRGWWWWRTVCLGCTIKEWDVAGTSTTNTFLKAKEQLQDNAGSSRKSITKRTRIVHKNAIRRTKLMSPCSCTAALLKPLLASWQHKLLVFGYRGSSINIQYHISFWKGSKKIKLDKRYTLLIFQQQRINPPSVCHRFFLQHLQPHQDTLGSSLSNHRSFPKERTTWYHH